MAFWGLMTVREHEAVVADLKATHTGHVSALRRDLQDECNSVARLVGQKTTHMTAIASLQCDVKNLHAELATLKAERDAILRDKKLETARRTGAVSHTIALTREIEALKPDALKYRERLRRDREALAAKRKRNAPAVRLTPAAPRPA